MFILDRSSGLIVKNKKIATNNKEKALRFEAHKAAPSLNNSPISSLESLITTENGHAIPPAAPPTPPSHMASILTKLSPNSLKDLILNHKHSNPDLEMHEEAEAQRKKKYSQQGELTCQPGDLHHLNEFHPVLVKAADRGNSYLPLHLFTSSNLTIIQSCGFSLPDKKIYLLSASLVRILKVDNSISGKELEMTEVQWQDTFLHYIE